MSKQRKILIGMAGGVVWSVLLIWIGSTMVSVPTMMRQLVQPFYALGPGIALVAIIGTIATRRFLTPDLIDGETPPPGSRTEIDLRVLRNTVEQAVVALCIWPAISILLYTDGPGVVLALTAGFPAARLVFWYGYHKSPPLRAFGFAATAYPTVLALLWALLLRVF
ncbi:MAPEG family protein [Psychromarinibacter sp. C21-152]|uniref:MAPEG family protein n=1 Tax=Psychromarinibacter sediminicola TaxID=3033385 RepID=A0AAE3T8D7_9RHOB|nr:MAPEG family protein [Psychromarinibacter sediminicola]MDF0600593.1 MAPEG family protein [Psychromarinibacter sediminicola]